MKIKMRHSQSLLLPLLLAVVSLLLISHSVSATDPVLNMPVDKAIHFIRRTSTSTSSTNTYGSKESLLRGSIVLFDAAVAMSAYSHTTVFIPSDRHISSSQWEALVALPVRGVVASTHILDTHNEELLQHYLSKKELPFPLYFLPEDGEASRELYETLTNLSPNTYAVVSVGLNAMAVAPVVIDSLTGIHLYASLTVRPKDVRPTEEMPRLLLTAGLDTLGVAPAARNSGGTTAAAAAVELWRRFNNDAATASDEAYDVSVLIGNTARLNYAGTSRWVGMRQGGELDKVSLVICLDELIARDRAAGRDDGEGAATMLFMHVHDSFAKSPQYAVVKAKAEEAAARNGVALTVLSAKTNYNHYDIRFEHEIFAHRQIFAVTFSAVRLNRVDQLFRGGRSLLVGDATYANSTSTVPQTNAATDLLVRRVNFVYDFAKALLGHSSEQSWIGSASYMSGLMHFATISDRSPLSKGGESQMKYAEALADHMKQRVVAPRRGVATDVTLTAYRYSPQGVQLVGPYEQMMRIFVVKSALIELMLLSAILLGVGAFSIVEFGFDKTKRIILNRVDDNGEPEH